MKKLMTLAGALLVAVAAQAQTAALDTVVELTELEIVSSRSDKRAPYSVTSLPKKDIVNQLGSRDLPNVLNTSPSVYSTNQGGGAGDSRLNVRGFNQRNTAIMINGVPVNDMENGWVYWSNWDGVGDATSNIQIQRG
ncbi:MAG: Plug domain-containing protein, partial [Schleiferiaceae bacterium]|nr:Plug domain-containing protein [Schleiferiaceae bacterium]